MGVGPAVKRQAGFVGRGMCRHGEMLIDGHFIGGPCDQSVPKAVIRSPFDGGLVGTAAEGDGLTMKGAIACAVDSGRSWRNSSIDSRVELLKSIAEACRAHQNELAELAALEIGKPVTQALGEVARTALTFELCANALATWGHEDSIPTGYDPRGAGALASVKRFPRGVVLGLTPYNWPYNLAAHKIGPAIAVGGSIVIKSSPKSLLCSYRLGRLLHEAGVPAGVVNVISCPNEAVLQAVQNPDVVCLSFTGSAPVGWKLKGLALPGCHVTLELGGDASCVLMADANVEDAITKIESGAFGYAGQVCIKVQRVLVHESIADAVRERLIKKTAKCQFGNPSDPNTVCGPVIDEEAAERIMAWIKEATELGASVLVGGKKNGNLIEPTLIENVSDDCKLGSEEVFGPVLCLETFSKTEQAIERVNRSRYGIHTGLFTSSEPIMDEFYSKLEVGGLIVNHVPTFRLDHLPYGGEKQSGFGREGITSTMDAYSTPKTLINFS